MLQYPKRDMTSYFLNSCSFSIIENEGDPYYPFYKFISNVCISNHGYLKYFRVNIWSTVKLTDVHWNQLINSTPTSRSQFINSIFKTRKKNLASVDGLILLSTTDFESGLGFRHFDFCNFCVQFVAMKTDKKPLSEYGQMIKSVGRNFTTCICTQISTNNCQMDLY